MSLLYAVHLPLTAAQQIARVLRENRLFFEQAENTDAILFFCDLPDEKAQTLPQDADLIRCLQSGVMSMNARRPGQYFFLVRKRQKSAALSLWLGESQQPAPRLALHALLAGESIGPLEASNISPGALDPFDTVILAHACVHTLPDTPEKMRARLTSSGLGSLRAQVVIPRRPEEALLARLLREGFALLPPGLGGLMAEEEPAAAIYLRSALIGAPPAHAAQNCLFFLDQPPTAGDLFFRAGVRYAQRKDARSLLPLVQLSVLLLCALSGAAWPAAPALLIPEYRALLHPRLLPGALVRLSFLPRHALISLNALLQRRFSRREYRLRFSCGPGAGPFFGTALLFLAARSVSALAAMFLISLLWLSAPALERALMLPARERIPLDEAERRRLHALNESAFASIPHDAASPSLLLAACAGCMLGFLEPDEAARRAEAMLHRLKTENAFDAACLLAAGQYLTERMADCDAALRPLPTKLEALAILPAGYMAQSALDALLLAAQGALPLAVAKDVISRSSPSAGMDALFLPRERRGASDLLLPMTHPHTFLRALAGEQRKSDPPSPKEEANRFLILAGTALDAPFHALLMRSARILPYASLLNAY